MNETTVRVQLEEWRAALRRNEAEHDLLVNLIRDFGDWLRRAAEPHQPAAAAVQSAGKGPRPEGTMSIRTAVLQVLRETHGVPLHTKEVWRRSQELGAVTTGKSPLGLVDLAARGLADKGVEKVGPRTWCYHASF